MPVPHFTTKIYSPIKQKIMKKLPWIFVGIATLLLIILFNSPVLALTPKHYTDLKFSTLKNVEIPNYERYQLNNGMTIYLMEDHTLPLISGTAIIRTGNRLEPAEKLGLADLTGTVMRIGGTQQHSADQLNQILEDKAAIVETSIGESAGSASFETLTEDLDTVFNLFIEVLRSPIFPEDKIQLAKQQINSSISRRNDDPGEIASREFMKVIYGENSPYSRTVEYANINNINRQDLVNFYEQYFHPNNLILGIVGDFNSEKIKQLINNKFADWKPSDKLNQNIPSAEQKNETGVFFINQPQLTQSNIRMGHLGGLANDPDYPTLTVLNGVLNGFGGRLFNEIRSRQGLAYSVYGSWQPNYDYPGTFVAGGQTRSDATVPFIQSLKKEIEKIRNNPISEAELIAAKDSILNSFVFNFQKPEQILSRLMRYDYFGYPADFIFTYQNKVKTTTIQDLQTVANKYLQPDKLVTLVVGNEAEIKPPLSTLNQKITTLDITIPEPNNS
jgi:zinc protease